VTDHHPDVLPLPERPHEPQDLLGAAVGDDQERDHERRLSLQVGSFAGVPL